MATVQDCIDGLHVTYPAVQDDQALLYFRQIHHEIVSQGQLELDQETVSLTAGTREYALSTSDKITSVRAAYYKKSAADIVKLTAVSTDWMDRNVDVWRTVTDTGDPNKFYIEATDAGNGDVRLGLDPIPDTTTSGGLPAVLLYGSTYQALVATDQIPAMIPSIRVYIEGMKKLWAADRDTGNLSVWDELYRRELHAALAYIGGTIEDLHSPRIVPAWMRSAKVE